jgi:hypothetical protein
LGNKNITAKLPLEFCNVLQKGKKHMGLEVFAEAFKVIGNPLVIAKLQNNSSETVCSDAVFVDLTICHKRELILETLFPSRVDSAGEETTTEASDSTSKEFSSNLPNERSASVSDQASDVMDEIKLSMHFDFFWKWLENVGSASADVSHFAIFSPELSLRAKLRVPCLASFASASFRIKVSKFFVFQISERSPSISLFFLTFFILSRNVWRSTLYC